MLVYPTCRLWTLSPDALRRLPAGERHTLMRRSVVPGIDLAGGYRFRLTADAASLSERGHAAALAKLVDILRDRIEEIGIVEAVVTPSEEAGVIVDVPISADTVLIKRLLGYSGLLTFQLFKEGETARMLRRRIDAALASDSTAVHTTPDAPFSSLLASMTLDEGIRDIVVAGENLPAVRALLADSTVQQAVRAFNRANPPAGEFVWAAAPVVRSGRTYYPLYFVKREPDVIGNPLVAAQVTDASAVTAAHAPYAVRVWLNDEERDNLTNVSSANVGKRIAIGLNKRIIMTLAIQGRIPNGQAEIPGGRTVEEAGVLATALRSGVLPLAVQVTGVAPIPLSMEGGTAAKQSGVKAALAALGLVSLFMIAVYRASGAFTVLGVLFQLIMTGAVLRLWIIAGVTPLMTLSGVVGLGFSVLLLLGSHIFLFERFREAQEEKTPMKMIVPTVFAACVPRLVWLHVGILSVALAFIAVGSGPLLDGALSVFSGVAAGLLTVLLLTRTLYRVVTSGWVLSRLSV